MCALNLWSAASMPPSPYVTHVPVMTGGYFYDDVRQFYATWFIGRWPADVQITPISRSRDRRAHCQLHLRRYCPVLPYEGTANQLSRNRRRPTSWGLAIMESRNGALCRTGRVAEAYSNLHRRSDRKDRARRGCCIQPGGNRRIHQVACAACRTDRT